MAAKITKRLTKRIKSDEGNAVLLMGLAIFGLVLLLGIFFVDVSKNITIVNSYSQYAQRATQAGLRRQDNVGNLMPEAVKATFDEYLHERNSSSRKLAGQTTTFSDGQNIQQSGGTAPFRRSCSIKYGKDPVMKVRMSTDREPNKGTKSVTFTYRDGVITPPISNYYDDFYRNSYKTIILEVQDYGDNYFFSLFGQPCSEYNVQATGVSIYGDAGQTGN